MHNFIQKIFCKNSKDTEEQPQAVTREQNLPLLHDTDNIRFFAYTDTLSILLENADLIDAIYERFSTLDKEAFAEHIYPILHFFADHMSIVPASQGCHDSDSAGLFRHSLYVASLALEFYHTDNTFVLRRRSYDNLFYDERALLILAMLHDFTKIVTDMDIYADDKCYNFYTATLDLFLKQYLKESSYIRVVFKDKRSRCHDNVQLKAIISSLLLMRLDNLIPLLSCGHDPIELLSFDSTNIYHNAIAICDRSAVRQNHSTYNLQFLKPAMSLKSYLRMCVINLIKSLSYEINSLEAQIFVTTQGVLFAACSQPFLDLLMLVHEHSSGCNFKDDDIILQTPVNVMRKAGLLKMYGTARVIAYHRLDLYDCTVFVKGIMFVTDTDDLYSLDCHMLESKDPQIASLLAYFNDKEGREPEIICVKNRSALPYYLDESVMANIEVKYLSLEQSYLQYEKDMTNASKRRYKRKMSAVSSMVTQAKKLSVIDIQRELELLQSETETDSLMPADMVQDGTEQSSLDNTALSSQNTDKKDSTVKKVRTRRKAAVSDTQVKSDNEDNIKVAPARKGRAKAVTTADADTEVKKVGRRSKKCAILDGDMAANTQNSADNAAATAIAAEAVNMTDASDSKAGADNKAGKSTKDTHTDTTEDHNIDDSEPVQEEPEVVIDFNALQQTLNEIEQHESKEQKE